MSIHRTIDGDWAECTDNACTLLFHLPDLTVAEAEALPMAALLPLLNAIDPPHQVDGRGTQVWGEPIPGTSDRFQMHREYGLPAVIWYDGSMGWRVHGKLHRDHDLPARVDADGTQTWYQHNRIHREGGKPAIIYPNGRGEYWLHDKRVEAPNA